MNDSPSEEFSDLESSLMETISREEYRNPMIDAANDIAEIALDDFAESFQDKTLSQVPIIKTIYSFSKAGFAIRDYLFLKKILRFVSGFKSVDDEFKQKINDKYSDSDYRRKVGRDLVNAISLFDQVTKSDYLFKVFHAYVTDSIDYEEFSRFIYALHHIDVSSIKYLKYFYENDDQKASYSQEPKLLLERKRELKKGIHFLQGFLFVGLISIDLGRESKVGDFPIPFGIPGKLLPNDFGAKFLYTLGECDYLRKISNTESLRGRVVASVQQRGLEHFLKEKIEENQRVKLVKYKGFDSHLNSCKVETISGGTLYVYVESPPKDISKDQFLLMFYDGGLKRLFKPI